MTENPKGDTGRKPEPSPSRPPSPQRDRVGNVIKEDRGWAQDKQPPAVKDTAEPPPPDNKKGG